ncbi:MAG: hypothetical protein ACOYOK_03955 [Pseudobdellovibrionaceae bacterium]
MSIIMSILNRKTPTFLSAALSVVLLSGPQTQAASLRCENLFTSAKNSSHRKASKVRLQILSSQTSS